MMAMTSMLSCSDDDGGFGLVSKPRVYHYSYTVSGVADEGLLVLDSLSSEVASVTGEPSWLSISQYGEENGCPVLRIANNPTPETMGTDATVTLNMKDGNTVLLTVSQGTYYIPDNNSNDTFFTDWENVEYVKIHSPYYTQGSQNVRTPWASNFLDTNIPEEIAENVKKKDGWEMAFSLIGDPDHNEQNYFALYNRYLGILRVFLYVTDPSTTGSEYNFEVTLGRVGRGNNKQMFYNSLPYAVPYRYTNINNNLDFVSSGSKTSYKIWSTPYNGNTSTALAAGWTAFDIDLSAYNPNPTDEKLDNAITFSCKTVSNQSMTLSGELTANIAGCYSSATPTASASSSGISSTLSSLGGLLGDVQNSALANIDAAVSGSSINKYFYYAGVACNVASFAYDWIFGDDKCDEQEIDSMPGKIDLNLVGQLNLSGYISSFASNRVHPLTVNVANIAAGSHVGQGVWNIQNDPVIYLVDDHLIGSKRRVNMTVGDDNAYSLVDASTNELRMVSVFDPESVVPLINPDIFPDVSDVTVTTYCGVFPNQEKGYTAQYRKLMSLTEPQLTLVDRSKKKKGDRYNTADSDSKMKYHMFTSSDLTTKQLAGKDVSSEFVKQKGAKYAYYGPMLGDEGRDAMKFMIDPQIYFPCIGGDNDNTIYDAELPDLVVAVILSFKSDGKLFTFSQNYVPKYEVISGNKVNDLKTRLTNYSNKSKNNQAINAVNGKGVLHPRGAELVQKSLTILDKITK